MREKAFMSKTQDRGNTVKFLFPLAGATQTWAIISMRSSHKCRTLQLHSDPLTR